MLSHPRWIFTPDVISVFCNFKDFLTILILKYDVINKNYDKHTSGKIKSSSTFRSRCETGATGISRLRHQITGVMDFFVHKTSEMQNKNPIIDISNNNIADESRLISYVFKSNLRFFAQSKLA